MSGVTIVEADLADAAQARDVVALLNILYEAAGFAQAHAGHEAGGALFYARRLD